MGLGLPKSGLARGLLKKVELCLEIYTILYLEFMEAERGQTPNKKNVHTLHFQEADTKHHSIIIGGTTDICTRVRERDVPDVETMDATFNSDSDAVITKVTCDEDVIFKPFYIWEWLALERIKEYNYYTMN